MEHALQTSEGELSMVLWRKWEKKAVRPRCGERAVEFRIGAAFVFHNSTFSRGLYHSMAKNITNTTWEQAWSRLNPQQQQAVSSIEGPVMVLAGPGTGKTQVLSLRIAHIVQQVDTLPQNILALTFTQAAAKNMQERLRSFLGSAAYQVTISTFHSFCERIIREYPEYFANTSLSALEPVNEVDQLGIIEDILRHGEFESIRSAKSPLMYVSSVLSLIGQYKQEGYTPDALQGLVDRYAAELEQGELTLAQRRSAETTLRRNQEVRLVFSRYQEALRQRGQFDFNDMILWVREALQEHELLRLELQERYQYVLVDEFQDTNQAQLEVLWFLTEHWGERANIFVVGDPNQSIFRFQGASQANTREFLARFPQAVVLSLDIGYRCPQPLYQSAAELIQHNPLPVNDPRLAALHQSLQSGSAAAGICQRYEAPTTLAECFWIVEQIRELIQQGMVWSDIAVIYRKHAHAELLMSVLEREGIPVVSERSQSVFDEPLVQQILTWWRFIAAVPQADEEPQVLPLLLLPWWEVPLQASLQLVRTARHNEAHGGKIWEFWNDDAALDALPIDEAARAQLRQLRDQLLRWQQSASNELLPHWSELVLRESRWYHYARQHITDWSEWNVLSSFLRLLHEWSAQRPQATLSEWLAWIDRLQAYRLKVLPDQWHGEHAAIQLVSAHKAKGLEWPAVFILHANDGYWGNVRARSGIAPVPGVVPLVDVSKDEQNEDERRLFYVAMTRAKQALFVSYSMAEPQENRTKELQVSQFVGEANMDAWSTPLEVAPDQLQRRLATYVAGSPASPLAQLDAAWIRSLQDSFAVSASALEDWIDCPVGFFFTRLVRIPVAPNEPIVLGNAVHAAMERLYRLLNATGTVPPLKSLEEVVYARTQRTLLTPQQERMVRQRALKIVGEFYDAHQDALQPALAVEKYFGGSSAVRYKDLRLQGKIDRIDVIDSIAKTVRVLDYKVSKPVSRNAIQGKTQNDDGRYFRQLVFYRLLAELDPQFPYRVLEGEIQFMEKNQSGRYKSERFAITDQDIAELQQQLDEFAEDMQNLAFLQRQPCGHCSTCLLLGLDTDSTEFLFTASLEKETGGSTTP